MSISLAVMMPVIVWSVLPRLRVIEEVEMKAPSELERLTLELFKALRVVDCPMMMPELLLRISACKRTSPPREAIPVVTKKTSASPLCPDVEVEPEGAAINGLVF